MRKSFTLIELLVVIMIMALLAGLLLPALQKAQERGKIGKCIATIANLQTALAMYEADYGSYPQSATFSAGTQHNGNSDSSDFGGSNEPKNLVGFLSGTSLGGPYMEFKAQDLDPDSTLSVLLDPWGQAYIYTARRYYNNVLNGSLATVSGSGPFHPDTSDTDNNTYNIYSLGPDKQTYGNAIYSGPKPPEEWDDGTMYDSQYDGDWESTTTNTDPHYDDINSWDGSRSF